MATAFAGTSGQEPQSIRFGDPEELTYAAEFFPSADYDPQIPSPTEWMGQLHGSRLSHHAEILQALRNWADLSARIQLDVYAHSHEGRELIRAVITAPENHARMPEIRSSLRSLWDPRGLSSSAGRMLIEKTPAVAWMSYSIHGDELSGADAAWALAHHLVADRSAATEQMLRDLVICIDPIMNPDGRERIVAMVEQASGYTPNLDYSSMQRGRWPFGRGNHYLFDLNRDWMAGVHPETRGRWRAARDLPPQLFVDAHEMWPLDTFLFYPQSQPHNPFLPAKLSSWHQVFGGDQAHAFDQFGWSYYTREWADAWGPFYSDAWGSLNGAVGILYEQASTTGIPHRRASGEVLTYRESVHHQIVSSMANLKTLQVHRKPILEDYLQGQRRNVSAKTPGNDRLFILVPGSYPGREYEFLKILREQGIEIQHARSAFQATKAWNTLNHEYEDREFPKGTWVVDPRQPQSRLVKSYLNFHVQMTPEALVEERGRLETGRGTQLYDVTSWCMALALGLNAWWCQKDGLRADLFAEANVVRPPGRVLKKNASTPVAWLVDGKSDAALSFAGSLLQRNVVVHVSDRDFRSGGRAFERGSLLVRRIENASDIERHIEMAARKSGVEVVPTGTGRSPDDGPDLGGGHFHLLTRPRVGLVGNAPFLTTRFGEIWHHLDSRIGVSVSHLDAAVFANYDLRRFNVLIFPSGNRLSAFFQTHKQSLQRWLENGGTMIATGSAAAALATEGLGFSKVRLRRNCLEDEQLERFAFAARRELSSRQVRRKQQPEAGEAFSYVGQPQLSVQSPNASLQHPNRKAEDAWQRRFAPSGVYLRAHTDPHSWLTVGCPAELAVYYSDDRVFLSEHPVSTPVRLSPDSSRLWISGLVWPEAVQRLQGGAWLTVEQHGKGQLILFAVSPAFRGYSHATARLLANAVVFGPGLGAQAPVPY